MHPCTQMKRKLNRQQRDAAQQQLRAELHEEQKATKEALEAHQMEQQQRAQAAVNMEQQRRERAKKKKQREVGNALLAL